MYSVVLMAALTTSAETPDCWFRNKGYKGGYASPYGACYGNCYGGYAAGVYGGYNCYGCSGCYGCYGCYGCAGCYGCTGYGPMIVPSNPMPPVKDEQLPLPMKDKPDEVVAPTKARLIVDLPADARLYIDDQPMKATSAQRTFNTPALERGQTYYYILKAEVVRDGQMVTQTRRVVLRPGEVVRANFGDMDVASTTRTPVPAAVTTARK